MEFEGCSSQRKRKYGSMTLAKQLEIINEPGNLSEIARNHNIPRSTVKSILSRKEKILKAIEEGTNTKRKRLREGYFPEVDKEVRQFHVDLREKHINVFEFMLKEKV